jgi:hypothetical protein
MTHSFGIFLMTFSKMYALSFPPRSLSLPSPDSRSRFPPPFQTHLRWPPPAATPTRRPSPSPPTWTTTDSPLYPHPRPPVEAAAASPRISTAAAPTGPPCGALRRGAHPRGDPGLRRRRRRAPLSCRAASSGRGGSRGRPGRGAGLGIPRPCRRASSRRGGSRGRSGRGSGQGTPPLPRPIPVLGREGNGSEEVPGRRRRRH